MCATSSRRCCLERFSNSPVRCATQGMEIALPCSMRRPSAGAADRLPLALRMPMFQAHALQPIESLFPRGSITAFGAEAAEKRPFSSTGTASLLFRSSATTSVMAAMGSASYRCPVASPSSVRAPPVGHSLTRLRRLSRPSSSLPDRDASWRSLPPFRPWRCVQCNRVHRPCRFRAASLPSCSRGASIAAIHGPTSTWASLRPGASCPSAFLGASSASHPLWPHGRFPFHRVPCGLF